MQWTVELDALLNQCAFSAGYDFAATCEALKQRAARLRLDCNELTAAACETQWMLLNPVVEDAEADGPELDPAVEADPCDWMLEGLAGDSTPSKLSSASSSSRPFSSEQGSLYREKTHEHRETESTRDPCCVCSSSDDSSSASAIADRDGGDGADRPPRLELSISEAELDELLCELPARDGQLDTDGKSEEGGAKSEMQWVIAFLTDPDATATTDAEAKQYAVAATASDIHDDDNYKGFLKDMSDANLLAASRTKQLQPLSDAKKALHWTSGKSGGQCGRSDQPQPDDGDQSDSDSDSDTDEWISTRLLIKQRSGCANC